MAIRGMHVLRIEALLTVEGEKHKAEHRIRTSVNAAHSPINHHSTLIRHF